MCNVHNGVFQQRLSCPSKKEQDIWPVLFTVAAPFKWNIATEHRKRIADIFCLSQISKDRPVSVTSAFNNNAFMKLVANIILVFVCVDFGICHRKLYSVTLSNFLK